MAEDALSCRGEVLMSRNVFGIDYSTRELRRRQARGKGAATQVARGVAGAYTPPHARGCKCPICATHKKGHSQ